MRAARYYNGHRALAAVWFWLFCWPAFAGVSCSLPFNLQNNTTADATQVMANYNALVTCLGNAAAAGTNSDITALLGLLTPIGPTAGGSSVYTAGASTGTANAQVVASPSPTGFSLTRGNSIIFIAGASNTGATQINVNGLGLTNFYTASPSGPLAMVGGEIVQNNLVWAVYDGTQFQLLWTTPQQGGFGPIKTLTSATTTDLGTALSHNVGITGTTTITSFGSSASAAFPIYKLNFSGSLTLTYNATSMILPGSANIQTQANDTAEALYLGSGNWQIINYTPVLGVATVAGPARCGFSGLSLTTTATTTVTWSWAYSILNNTAGTASIASGSKSGTLSIASAGSVNQLDTGAAANDTFYALWGISNGTTWGMVATLSANATPALPTGYVWECYAGSVRTGGAATFYGTRQTGDEAVYVLGGLLNTSNIPNISGGLGGSASCGTTTPTYASITVRGSSGAPSGTTQVWVPPTAAKINMQLVNNEGGGLAVGLLAPSTSYTGIATAKTPPLYLNSLTNNTLSIMGGLLLEANTIGACGSGGVAPVVYGWKDAVNAN